MNADTSTSDFDFAPESQAAGAAEVHRSLSAGAGISGYAALVAFYAIYFYRPEDFIPGAAAIPVEKLIGGLAALGLLGAIVSGRFRPRREGVLMIALLTWLSLCIPTAIWRGHSFTIVAETFSKVIVVMLATICMVDSLARCRRLLFIYTTSMLIMAALAFHHGPVNGRLMGVGSMFDNSDDFGIELCMVMPFCVMFSVLAKTRMRSLFWAAAACFDVAAVGATYTRGAFLGLVVSAFLLAFRFRGGVRNAIVVFSVLACLFVAFMGKSYTQRLDTILHPDSEESSALRLGLLHRSIQLTLEHPLLGIGPGDFEQLSGSWHETHNTYTELSAETGIPALGLFLAVLWCGFQNAGNARKRWPGTERAVIATALTCSLAGYAVCAFFLSTAYWLTPYLLVALSALVVGNLVDAPDEPAETGEAAYGSDPALAQPMLESLQ